MIKNIFIYLGLLAIAFGFNVFFYAWFSWYLLVLTLCVPILSLVLSLPFMIFAAVKGLSVFMQNELVADEKLCIGITPKKSKGFFCPLMKIKFKTSNRFAQQKKKLNVTYSGFLTKPVYLNTDVVTRNCGYLEVKAKYFKIYDLLGIFFIPVKLNCSAQVLVKPKLTEPAVLPDTEQNKIIGYKPKTSGFAEEYELRDYQQGDSLKNVHWKISARQDDLIVKEPSTPVYRPLVITPIITSTPKENNITLGKLAYSAKLLNNNKTVFYCAFPNGEVCEIHTEDDIKNYLLRLLKGEYSQGASHSLENPLTYTIACNGEAVSA